AHDVRLSGSRRKAPESICVASLNAWLRRTSITIGGSCPATSIWSCGTEMGRGLGLTVSVFMRVPFRCLRASPVQQWIGDEPNDRGAGNNNGLLQVLELPQQQQRDDGQDGAGNVDDRAFCQHDGGAADGTDRCGRNAVDERNERRQLAI